MAYDGLVYCSCPSRLGELKPQIMDFVAERGKAPLHPFNAFPYEYYEGGIVGREATIEVCCRLIDICDEFWLFGISEGTIIELEYFYNSGFHIQRPFRDLAGGLDPDWRKHTAHLAEKYEYLIERISSEQLNSQI